MKRTFLTALAAVILAVSGLGLAPSKSTEAEAAQLISCSRQWDRSFIGEVYNPLVWKIASNAYAITFELRGDNGFKTGTACVNPDGIDIDEDATPPGIIDMNVFCRDSLKCGYAWFEIPDESVAFVDVLGYVYYTDTVTKQKFKRQFAVRVNPVTSEPHGLPTQAGFAIIGWQDPSGPYDNCQHNFTICE